MTYCNVRLIGAIGSLLFVVLMAEGSTTTATTRYSPPKLADGQPDLEGTWTNASLTRLERPVEYGNRSVLSDQEVRVLEKKNADLVALGNKPTDPKATVND